MKDAQHDSANGKGSAITINGFRQMGKSSLLVRAIDKCRDCGRQFVENPPWKHREMGSRVMIDRLLLEKIPLAGIALSC